MRQEWLDDMEIEALAIMRSTHNSCGFYLSAKSHYHTLYAVALAHHVGLKVSAPVGASKDVRHALRCILASLTRVWGA